jgi:predicted RNA binding protein YcfA (HicA-like mRNA interferase family)
MPKLPGIHHKDAIRVLEKIGWGVIHEGKHTIMGNIAKAAGLTPDEFRRLL